MDGTLVISRRPEDEIIAELLAKNFDVIAAEKAQDQQQQQQQDAEEEEEDSSDDPSADREVARVKSQKGYDYLLNMSIRSLTEEKVWTVICIHRDMHSLFHVSLILMLFWGTSLGA